MSKFTLSWLLASILASPATHAWLVVPNWESRRAAAPYRSTWRCQRALAAERRRRKGSSGEGASEHDFDEAKHHLEEDIVGRLSISKDRALSALNQPTTGNSDKIEDLSGAAAVRDGKSSPPSRAQRRRDSRPQARHGRRTTMKRNASDQNRRSSSLVPPSSGESTSNTIESSQSKRRRQRNSSKNHKQKIRNDSSFSSLLPPPLPSAQSESRQRTNATGSTTESESLSSGLSSWEEFLGRADGGRGSGKLGAVSRKKIRKKNESRTTSSPVDAAQDTQLPAISDLFPSDLTSSSSSGQRLRDIKSMGPKADIPGESLDGVLPVSELFYRSSQALLTQNYTDSQGGLSGQEAGDDEELPFSAEQSDELTTDGNKVKIRRNLADRDENKAKSTSSRKKRQPKQQRVKRIRGRKMVRRGMEMLVGGTPINADPPLRAIELMYRGAQESGGELEWANAITTNMPDYGRLLYSETADTVSKEELGLFCEYFVSAALKWDVCPNDLRDIVRYYRQKQVAPLFDSNSMSNVQPPMNVNMVPTRLSNDTDSASVANEDSSTFINLLKRPSEEDNILSLLRYDGDSRTMHSQVQTLSKDPLVQAAASPRGFGKKRGKDMHGRVRSKLIAFGLKLSIGVTKKELNSCREGDNGHALRRVLKTGITSVLSSFDGNLTAQITKLRLTEGGEGHTVVNTEFTLHTKGGVVPDETEKTYALVDSAMVEAVDGGDLALAFAAAAQDETGWDDEIRDRVVEEFLFEDDDVDNPIEDAQLHRMRKESKGARANLAEESLSSSEQERENRPGARPNGELRVNDEYEGVFFDYSSSKAANAPFNGELGPLLLDAATTRATQRHPRVIAIGDVHGCIDELQDLLRACEYQPGDQVVFLGDLVSKGPDSISVIQMAREIGAIGIRGNHDFEVIRWHQAIKSGVDPPVVGSEHFHIASCLSDADMKWMHSLPWYISSKELGALFVHAGFVSGIRLAKQNPRLMMNMRSILPDGTVTSKFFNNWPWARLWDGPQTVLFGHDADRGLQQYEHAIGLDTGCVYGGRLTACILPEKRLVSVSARREYFQYRRKHYD